MPILIDTSDRIVAGHARVLTCQKLGWTEVPTVCLSRLSEAQAKAYRIADNRLAETAGWDDELLAETLRELSTTELEFSLEDIGFDMGEIDFRIETRAPSLKKAERAEKADTLPATTTGPAITRAGDPWQFGPHRVPCASALEDSSYQTLMGGY